MTIDHDPAGSATRARDHLDLVTTREDQRPPIECVWRDEGDSKSVDAPADHRAAGREVVARRTRRRRDEHTVAAKLAQLHAVDCPFEHGHPAQHVGGDQHIVDRDKAPIGRLDCNRWQLDDFESATKDQLEVVWELVGAKRSQKAKGAVVDTNARNRATDHAV